ncbi:MAG: alginate export family protein [Bryobacteraceae bacterium]|nr:alginate export family protein [Bryobacteraceae bacterium]
MMFRILLPTLAAAATVLAQTAAPSGSPVRITGGFRTRAEIWDWFEGSGDHRYAFSGNILRVSLAQARGDFDWQLELAAPFLLGLPERAIAAAPQGQLGLGATYFAANGGSRNPAMIFPKQGFLRWKGLFGDRTQSLRLGRFEWMDGGEVSPKDPTLAALKRDRINQRLIGPFAWTHTGRSFDGVHYTLGRPRLNVTALAVIATRGAFQTDGWGQLRTGFATVSATGQTGDGKNAGEWRVSAIYYQDWRHVLKTDNRPLAARQRDSGNIRLGTVTFHYLYNRQTRAGSFNALVWAALQTGRWGALDHRAGAVNLEGGWQPPALKRLKPWLEAGLAHASGDKDPTDRRHGTFHQLLPTPRPFARTPFYNMMNSQDYFGMLTLRPHGKVTVRSEYHAVRLTEAADLWYAGGGAFQPWSFGYSGRNTGGARSIANLWDASCDVNLSAHVGFGGYFGHMQGKAAVRRIYPQRGNGNFGYLELTYRF